MVSSLVMKLPTTLLILVGWNEYLKVFVWNVFVFVIDRKNGELELLFFSLIKTLLLR